MIYISMRIKKPHHNLKFDNQIYIHIVRNLKSFITSSPYLRRNVEITLSNGSLLRISYEAKIDDIKYGVAVHARVIYTLAVNTVDTGYIAI